jgi:hypothetical protein
MMMESTPIFRILAQSLIELEYALADFRLSTISLSESLNFVGLEFELIKLLTVTRSVLEAERAMQSAVVAKRKQNVHIT